MGYLKIENINKFYGEKKILEDISFLLEKGEICAILGRSGVGKTTLFNILAGFENSDNGRIFLEGVDITNEKKNISYMTQKHLLMPYFTVLDNVCLNFTIRNIPKEESYKKAEPILEKFGLYEHKDKYPAQLSGGMKQRVSFIRAFLKQSDLMLFDEPFSALDSITKHNIYEWFKQINKEERRTTIFITHDINEAIYLADKIFVLENNPANIVLKLKILGRDKEDFRTSPEFAKYYNEIMKIYLEK